MPTGIPTPKVAQHPTIKATGAKGFLQWLATENPHTYAKIQPQLSIMAQNGDLPSGPGTGSQNLGRIGRIGKYGRLGYLGDCCGLAPISLNTCAITVCSATQTAITNAPSTCSVTAAAPSSGSSSTSWLSSIASLVQGAETAVTANQATQIQLARAKAGLPPLNLSAYGVSTTPGLNLGLSSSTLGTVALVAVLAVVGIFVFKKA